MHRKYKNNMELEIEKKPKVEYVDNIKISCPQNVYNLKEVQEIKDAVQEHLLFVGLDRRNNLRKIIMNGVGTTSSINIDAKDIVRNALVNACDRVILVHNHPSNCLDASKQDKHLTNNTNGLLNLFKIELLDHIIVTENEYVSMREKGWIDKNYINEKLFGIDEEKLKNENKLLKAKIKRLENMLEKNKELER